VSETLKKTAADFKDPAFSLVDMLRSIAGPQQFDQPDLAVELAQLWGMTSVPLLSQKKK
jgi:hypothetical protein